MKPFQLLRNSPPLRSALQQTFNNTASLSPPKQPPPLLNLLTRSTPRRPLSNNNNNNLLARAPRRTPFSAHTPRRPYTTQPPKRPYDPTASLNSPTPSLSLSQRLRKLSREYGWSAFGVYMLLSALDFPFCFAAVRYLGTDRIGRYEHVAVEWVKGVVPESVREAWRQGRMTGREGGGGGGKGAVAVAGEDEGMVEGYAVVVKGDGDGDGGEVGAVGYDHGVKEAEERNESENASIWTQLALAYAIHKSFIFIRVPLTVAVTPKVVKVLRGWGWDIGKRRPKGAK